MVAASASSRDLASGFAPTRPSANCGDSATSAVRSGGAGAGPGGQLTTQRAPLQETEGGRVAKPGARQPFESRAHQGRTDRGRHRTVSLREFAGHVNASGALDSSSSSVRLEGNSDNCRAVLPALWSQGSNVWTAIQSNGVEYGQSDVAPLLLLGRHRARKRTIPTAGRPAPTAETSDSLIPPAASGSFGSRGPASQQLPGTLSRLTAPALR